MISCSLWLGHVTYLLRSHRLLGSLVQFLDGLLVVAQILLAADQDDGEAVAEVEDLRDPLSVHVSYFHRASLAGHPYRVWDRAL